MRRFFYLALLAAAAQPALRAADGPTGLVRIDAIAADASGRLVQDLAAEDFEVLEEGTPRQIQSVRFIRASTTQEDAVPPAALSSSESVRIEATHDGARLFALFLDEYHVTAGPAVDRARAALTEFVERHLGPRDLVLIVKPLDSLPNLSVTRDRAAIRDAIAGFVGRNGDYTPRSAFEQNFMATDPPRIEAVRAQISLSALNAIALYLGPLTDGRKTIIMVSEGFVQGPRRRGEAGLPSVETVIRSANRANASIYPIDPRALLAPATGGVGAAAPEPGLTMLRALATETHGQAILANADVNAGMNGIVSDSSGYYLIAFQPAHAEERGRFHVVDVRVKRPGVALRTRTGYWERPPDAAAVLRAAATTPVAPARHASPLIRPWFGMSRGDDGKTRVQFVWESAARIPGDRTRTADPVRLTLHVLDTKGTVLFESVIRAANQAAGPGNAASPTHAVFEVPPGRVELRMRIEDASSKVLDTDVRDLIVAPMAGLITLGTAQVYRTRNAREFRELENEPAAPPVVTRQFSRMERLLIRVPVFATAGTPLVTARLVSGMGQIMRDLPVTAASDSEVKIVDVPLSGLAAGEYHIDVVATGEGARAQDRISFRIVP
jgi:VWFA-related protein